MPHRPGGRATYLIASKPDRQTTIWGQARSFSRVSMISPLRIKTSGSVSWRRVAMYEAVYLHELRDGLEAERIIGSWVSFYNEVRPHSALGGRTPREAYREGAEVS